MRVNKVYNIDGLKFDSKLELACYEMLVKAGIYFEFQFKYILQEKFKYNGKIILPITLTVDFLLPEQNIIIDPKGFQREENKMKWKMLRAKLFESAPVMYFPKSISEMEKVISEIRIK